MRNDLKIALLAMIIALAVCSSYAYLQHSSEEFHDPMESVIEISGMTEGSIDSAGTGFAVEYKGSKYIVTNAHVVSTSKGDSYKVYDSLKGRMATSEQWFDLSVISFDIDNDLAVLYFDDSIQIKGLEIETSRAHYGDRVSIIGNAMGYGLSIKEGVVSVPEINITVNGSVRECIMVSTTINHGDSGSPILNDDGNVIGISSFKMKENGTSISGMSYGILASSLDRYLSYLIDMDEGTMCSVSLQESPNCVFDTENLTFSSVYKGVSITISGQSIRFMNEGEYVTVTANPIGRDSYSYDFEGWFSNGSRLDGRVQMEDDVSLTARFSERSNDVDGDIYRIVDGEAYICSSDNMGPILTIPDSIELGEKRYKVTGISSGAFRNMVDIAVVELPSTINVIESSAFEGCTGLETIVLSKNLEVIGESAFKDCISLSSVSIPRSVRAIGERAFQGCDSLETVTLGTRNIEMGSSYRNNGEIHWKGAFVVRGYDYTDDIMRAATEDIVTLRLSYERCYEQSDKGYLISIYDAAGCMIGVDRFQNGNYRLDTIFGDIADIGCIYRWKSLSGEDIGETIEIVNNDAVFIRVIECIVVTNITLDHEFISTAVGLEIQLRANVTPWYATDASVIWISTDPDVASVDSEGCVMTLSEGNTSIVAVSRSGDCVYAICRISVEGLDENSAISSR